MKLNSRKKKIIIAIVAGATLVIGVYLTQVNQSSSRVELNTDTTQTTDMNEEEISNQQDNIEKDENTATEPAQPTTEPVSKPVETKWPVLLTTEQASSTTVVVNKKYKLPESYAPGLRNETSSALQQLFNAASNSGFTLKTISSYRSYSKQQSTYQGWVNRDGQAAADTYSARAGHSEHQTGLAVDVGNGTCDLETCFGETDAGLWVASNAQNYGFIIRYPNSKDSITGYQYEPWHLRYVGVNEAKAITASGLTMEQYYGFEGGGYN